MNLALLLQLAKDVGAIRDLINEIRQLVSDLRNNPADVTVILPKIEASLKQIQL